MEHQGGWQRLCKAKTYTSFRGSATNFPEFVSSCPAHLKYEFLMRTRSMVASVLDEDDTLLYHSCLEVEYFFNHGGVSYSPRTLDTLAKENKEYLLSILHQVPNITCRFIVQPYDPDEMGHEHRIELQLYYRWADTIQLRFFQERVPVVNPDGPTCPWVDLGVATIRQPEYVRRQVTVRLADMEDFEASFQDQRMLARFRSYDCVRMSYMYTPGVSYHGIEFQKKGEHSFEIHFEPIRECFGWKRALQVWYRWRGYTFELAVQEPGEMNTHMITLANLNEFSSPPNDMDVDDDSSDEEDGEE